MNTSFRRGLPLPRNLTNQYVKQTLQRHKVMERYFWKEEHRVVCPRCRLLFHPEAMDD